MSPSPIDCALLSAINRRITPKLIESDSYSTFQFNRRGPFAAALSISFEEFGRLQPEDLSFEQWRIIQETARGVYRYHRADIRACVAGLMGEQTKELIIERLEACRAIAPLDDFAEEDLEYLERQLKSLNQEVRA